MSTIDLINAIETGDSEAIEKNFQELMADRVSAALDNKREELAQSMFAEAVDVGDSDEAEDNHHEHSMKTKPTHEWKDDNGAHHKVWHTTHEGKKSTLLHTSEAGASSAPVMRLEQPGHHKPDAIKKSMKSYND
jgi:hypothetical protein